MADFWAGYLSGIAGIIIGSPLDIIKTRSQSQVSTSTSSWYQSPSSLVRDLAFLLCRLKVASETPKLTGSAVGTAVPIFGQGALNALLFYSYNRSLLLLGVQNPANLHDAPLWKIFLGGAGSGIACFVLTTPMELIKCRAQVTNQSSWGVAKELYMAYGRIGGFYLGGTVTGLRDAVGYGFYFWAYEGSKRYFSMERAALPEASTLLCGGIAGMVGWAAVYPLDVVKTRVQVQAVGEKSVGSQGLLGRPTAAGASGGTVSSGYGPRMEFRAWECAKKTYRDGGMKVFWNGIWGCLGRGFIVNAVVFYTYEWALERLSGNPAGNADREHPTVSAI
ncbi:solute carrier family 25 protein [Tirmania nivea]|nr:solute carrier family 25 protein [Tirmania nivea]